MTLHLVFVLEALYVGESMSDVVLLQKFDNL